MKVATLVGGMAVVLCGAACAGSEPAMEPERASWTVLVSPPGERAADPVLAALEAEVGPLHLDELPPDQVVVVQIGARWCEPCRRAEQAVGELHVNDDGITFVDVALEEDPRDAESVWTLDSRSYAVADDGPIGRQFRTLPATLVYARAGETLVDRFTGFDAARRSAIERAVAVAE